MQSPTLSPIGIQPSNAQGTQPVSQYAGFGLTRTSKGNIFAKDPAQPVATGALLIFAGVGLVFGLGGYRVGRRR